MEFTTENGAKVAINMADFIETSKLRVAIFGAIKDSGVKLSGIELDQLLSGDKDEIGAAVKSGALDSVLEIVMSLDCSEKVNNEIFNCLQRSTYNSEKITRQTFDPEEARADYYYIIFMCIKVHLSPFFKTLFSQLSGLAQMVKNQKSQKSK